MTTVGSPYAGLQVLVPEETRSATSSCGPPPTPSVGQLLAREEATAVARVGREPLKPWVRIFVGNGTVDCKARKDMTSELYSLVTWKDSSSVTSRLYSLVTPYHRKPG